MIGEIAVGTPYVTTSARSVVNTRKLKVIDMKQTVEEAAKAFAEECRIVNIKAGLDYPYDEIDMRNAFKAGAEWQAKQFPWISVKERLPEENRERNERKENK